MDIIISVNLLGLVTTAIALVILVLGFALSLHNDCVKGINKAWELKLNYRVCLCTNSRTECDKKFGLKTTNYST